MTETTTPAPGTGAATPEATRQPASSAPHPAEVRKQLKALRAERDQYKAQIDQLAEANKSETEKAIEKARREAAAETESRFQKELAAEKTERLIERAVLEYGLPADLVHVVKAKLEDVEDIKDIKASVLEIVKGLDWAKPKSGGQPGFPSGPSQLPDYPRNGRWDQSQIRELIANGQYQKYRAEIEKAQREAWKRGENL